MPLTHDPKLPPLYEPEPDISPPGALPSLPDAVIEEEVEDLSADEWDPNFPLGELATVLPQHFRLDSRRWLVLPDRYLFRPLRGLAAARASDALVSSPHGRALASIASRLMREREALADVCAGEFGELGPDRVQAEVDARMEDFVAAAYEEFLGTARASGVGFSPGEWLRGWLESCDVRRVPLPSRRVGEEPDPGGRVHSAKGVGAWETYYEGRYVHLLRLAAACAWYSCGPFSFDLRPRR